MSSCATNFVHVDENWRQRIRKEVDGSRTFEHEWGFLISKEVDTQRTRPKATRLVKYFNPAGGTWTVVNKRIPGSDVEQEEELNDGQVELLKSKPNRSALENTRLSHAVHMSSIRPSSSVFKTTYDSHGSRLPLEQFGVAEHGRRLMVDLQPSDK